MDIVTLFTTKWSDFADIIDIFGLARYESIYLYSTPGVKLNLAVVVMPNPLFPSVGTPRQVTNKISESLLYSREYIDAYEILYLTENQRSEKFHSFSIIDNNKLSNFEVLYKTQITWGVKPFDKILQNGYLNDTNKNSAYTRIWKTNHCGYDLCNLLGRPHLDTVFGCEVVEFANEAPEIDFVTYGAESLDDI